MQIPIFLIWREGALGFTHSGGCESQTALPPSTVFLSRLSGNLGEEQDGIPSHASVECDSLWS